MREKRKCKKAAPIHRNRPWCEEAQQAQYSSVLLLWALLYSPVFSSLCRNVTREVVSYVSVSRLLPMVIRGGHLWVANICTEKCYEVSPFLFNWCDFIPVDRSRVVCIAREANFLVYHLNMFTLELTKLTNLPETGIRGSFPSYCCISTALYVLYSIPNHNQKFSLCGKQWSSLPNPDPLWNYIKFLVPYLNNIFIFFDDKGYQIFNTPTEQFQGFYPFPAPVTLHWDCPRVVEGDQLLCVHKGYTLWTLNLTTHQTTLTTETSMSEECPKTRGLALLVGKDIYWVDRKENSLCKICADTSETRKSCW